MHRVAPLVASLLLLAACGGGPLQPSGAARAAGGAAPTELRLAVGGEPEEGFDPTLGWGEHGSPLFQSTLLRRDHDLALAEDLATGWEVSEDGLTWTVALRDDVTFTDGEPLTAEDVVYTFATAAGTGAVRGLDVLEETEALDEATVVFRLREPRSTFVNRLTTLGIVPAHAHGDGYGRSPVGSGPFVLERWDEGQQLVAVRNDDHHGEQSAFERVVFLFAEEDATMAAVRSGEVHVASVPQTLADAATEGMRLVPVESVDNRGIVLPFQPDEGRTTDEGRPIGNAVTSDLAVRRAVNHAIDRAALVDGILEGHGSPAMGPVDGLPWYEPSSAIDDADPERAAALLDEAGWIEGSDGVREKGGTRAAFELLYPSTDSVRQGLAVAVADMLTPLGLDVRPRGASWDEIPSLMHSTPVLFGWGSHDQTEMYDLHHSSRAAEADYLNAGMLTDASVDASLDAAMAARDEAEALQHWRAAQLDGEGDGFATEGLAAWAWLVNLDHTYLVDDCLDLGGLQVQPHGHGWPITAGITGWQWTC
jgi:peptide/nickel transport system substrate-binding protein